MLVLLLNRPYVSTTPRPAFSRIPASEPPLPEDTRLVWFGSFKKNSNTLTNNYNVKQSQFTKPNSEPCARNSEDSNEAFDRVI